jgi:ribonuclease J
MVAISHSHLDHVGLLPYLRTDIPVLLTDDTHKLLKALDDVLDGPKAPLKYQPVAPNSTTQFGPFTITAVPVDHDTPGACAFLIETPELRFVYSGDLRLHGAHPERTEEFARRAREFQPDVLFIEGTRAMSDSNEGIYAESQLPQVIADTVSSSSAGVYFTFYPRHPQRLDAFVYAAKVTGRKLVLDAASAYIYEQFGGDVSSCLVYGGNAHQWTAIAKSWVESKGLSVISPPELCGREVEYLVEMLYPRLVDWVDIDVQPGARFLHSNGAPLGPFDPSWNNLMEWLKAFEVELCHVGSTGHASRADILHIIDTISPKVLMPIHSMHPERIGLTHVKRIMPEYGKTYTAKVLEEARFPTDAELEPAIGAS